jgi:hypothetical protein
MDQNWMRQMMSIGIVSYDEQERMWEIGHRCARDAGLPLAGGLAVAGMQVGTVTIPGVGTVSGAVAGALAGLVSGTLTCTALNIGLRDELRALAEAR